MRRSKHFRIMSKRKPKINYRAQREHTEQKERTLTQSSISSYPVERKHDFHSHHETTTCLRALCGIHPSTAPTKLTYPNSHSDEMGEPFPKIQEPPSKFRSLSGGRNAVLENGA